MNDYVKLEPCDVCKGTGKDSTLLYYCSTCKGSGSQVAEQ